MMDPHYPVYGHYMAPMLLAAEKVTPAQLSAAMSQAVHKKNLTQARDIMDTAFWRKVHFKPDWFHLFLAVQQEDRAMTRLLTTHGATWTPAQAQVARLLLGEKCASLAPTLRQAGIRLLENSGPEELRDRAVAMAAIATIQRVLTEDRNNGADTKSKEGLQAQSLLDMLISDVFADAVLDNDTSTIDTLLSLRRTGAKPAPLDVSQDVLLLLLKGKNHATVIDFIDRLRDAHIAIKPVCLPLDHREVLLDNMPLVPALSQRELLGGDVSKLREFVLSCWTVLQNPVYVGTRAIILDDSVLERRQADFRAAAGVICAPVAHPITLVEADEFVRRHNLRLPKFSEALNRAERALHDIRFFDQPAFTADRLNDLADLSTQSDLRAQFRAAATRRIFADKGLPHFLCPEHLEHLIAVLENKGFRPDAQATGQILSYLAKRADKEGSVSDAATRCLQALKRADADFTGLKPTDYLGKKAPLLARALLHTDIFKAGDFNLDHVRAKLPDRLQLFTLATSRHYAYTEFLLQLEIERKDPARGLPLRQSNATLAPYQQHYLSTMAANYAPRYDVDIKRQDPTKSYRRNGLWPFY